MTNGVLSFEFTVYGLQFLKVGELFHLFPVFEFLAFDEGFIEIDHKSTNLCRDGFCFLVMAVKNILLDQIIIHSPV